MKKYSPGTYIRKGHVELRPIENLKPISWIPEPYTSKEYFELKAKILNYNENSNEKTRN